MQDQGVNRLEKIEILTPGQRLREIRRKLGLRQEDLAGKIYLKIIFPCLRMIKEG